jgi:LysR family cys regulon transcriptional activator
MAYKPETDSDLVSLDASHLFDPSITRIGFRRGAFIRGFMYEFIEQFAPHLTQETVDRALSCTTKIELESMFADIHLPEY